MNELQTQTDALIQALTALDVEVCRLRVDFAVAMVVIVALLIIIACKRRPK